MEPIKKTVRQVSTQIDRERDQFAMTLGITGTQMSVIDFLSNQTENSASQNQIEHEFEIQRSTTTIMLQRMEKRELIRRVVNKNDKRQKKVQLTEKAEKLVKQIHQYMKNDDLALRKNFSEEELETARKVLNYIKDGQSAKR